jgi:hypothetical protein
MRARTKAGMMPRMPPPSMERILIGDRGLGAGDWSALERLRKRGIRGQVNE